MSDDNNLRGNPNFETEHVPQNRLLTFQQLFQQDRTIDTNHTAASCVDKDAFLCKTLTSRNQCNDIIYGKPKSEHCQKFCGTCDTFRSNNKRTRSAENISIYHNETEQSQKRNVAALIGMTCFVFFTLMSSWIFFMKRKSIKKMPYQEEEEYETDENSEPRLNDTPIVNDIEKKISIVNDFEKKYIDAMMISHQRKTGVNAGPNIELLRSIPSEESILSQSLEFDDVDGCKVPLPMVRFFLFLYHLVP